MADFSRLGEKADRREWHERKQGSEYDHAPTGHPLREIYAEDPAGPPPAPVRRDRAREWR